MSSPAGGTILAGKYRLERPLNAGGMGSVWVAKHVELDVEVAVKLISWVQALKPVAVERFKREARAAAQIRSPHVVQILDYGVHDGVPYMAMELLAGEDLADHLKAHGSLQPARMLEILRPACKALGLAHQAGIVHRDIKPANIFLARVGDDEVVKVLDFGIAKETSREAQHTTGTGLVGSPLYMSPEQMKASDVDLQSDLWSLAVVLYEALSGQPPFDAPSLPQLFQVVSHSDAPPIGASAPQLAMFDDFFRRGLSRDKAGRFTSVRELLAAFEAASAHVTGVVTPPVRLHSPRSSTVASAETEALASTKELGATKVDPPQAAVSNVETLDALADLPSSAELARPRTSGGGTKPATLLAIGAVGTVILGIGAAATGLFSGLMTPPSSLSSSSAIPETPSAVAAGQPAPTVAAQELAVSASASASASALASASASASAAPVVTPGGQVARPVTPRPPATGKPTSLPPAPNAPPTADPIWGVPVSR